MDRLIVLSPHYDDGALSCGQLLAGHHNAVLATMCTGLPREDHEDEDGRSLVAAFRTEYDNKSGFMTSSVAVASRRMEDMKAAGWLGVERWELGLIDNQYGGSHQLEYSDALLARLRDPFDPFEGVTTLVGPLATAHPDHEKTMMSAVASAVELGWPLYLYEELPHRVMDPEATAAAAANLDGVQGELASGWVGDIHLEPPSFIGTGDMARKRGAVACYQSQHWALNLDCVFVPERYWRVTW